MSVDNPSDSGGGAEVAFANPSSITDMGAMGSWAEIMAEEQVETAMPGEKRNESQNCDENPRVEDSIRKQPKQQCFAVQVTNLPGCSAEELFYYFGGDNVVRDVAFLPDRPCAARIDLFTLEGLKRAKELDGKKFRGRNLKVYEIRDDRIRKRPSQQEFHNRQYSNEATPYNRENNRYNSQSSLHSNDARNFERNSRPYTSSNDCRNIPQNRGAPMGGTFSRGKSYNNYDDYNNGRHPSGGQSCRGNGQYYQNAPYGGGGYPSRSRGIQGRGSYGGSRGTCYGSQELSRSDSYRHGERDKPAVISRSRTESTAFDSDRRRVLLSRTSSRLSTSTEEVDAPVPRVKKLTNKDIFGEAKPVDTSERLREIEAKQERERILEQQKYKEEAEAARLATANDHREGTSTHQHQNQYGVHHGHVAHHSSHHQYHHVPSRHSVPSHSHPSYGLYQSTHGISQHSHGSYTNSEQFHQPYDVSVPTSYRIMRRDSADPTDASPPLDPVHTKLPIQAQVNKEIEEGHDVVDGDSNLASDGNTPVTSGKPDSSIDRRNTGDMNTNSSVETLPRSLPKHRVFCNAKYVSAPLQKSVTMDEIREPGAASRGRVGRGGRSGRGFNRGGAASGRRSSFSGLEKLSSVSLSSRKPSAIELEGVERTPSTEVRSSRSDLKDNHGSYASLRGRMGTLRRNRGGGGGYLQERTLRVSRGEDGPWSGFKNAEAETRKEQSKFPEERLEQLGASEEMTSTQSVRKDDSKALASSNSQSVLTSSTTSVQERKKEKKKTNKKETTRGGKTLNNNKFALLIDSED